VAWSALLLTMIVGVLLRWIWIEDMEWKQDERWSYEMSQTVDRTAPWPRVGMATSLGFPNPGLSVWIFIALGLLTSTPTGLALLVGALNVLGLIGFSVAIRGYLPARSREPWLWGIALQAINPYAIRLSRKIWAQSILTPFVLVLWTGQLNRRTWWGSFLWGLIGSLLGQIHLSGWFLAIGLALGTAIHEARGQRERLSRWGWWLLGTGIGMVGAVPWIFEIWGSTALGKSVHITLPSAGDVFATGYLLCSIPLGTLPYQGLGLGPDAEQFARGPVVGGVHWHLVEIAQIYITLIVAGVSVWRLVVGGILPALWRLFRSRDHEVRSRPDASAPSEPCEGAGGTPSTAFYLGATVAIPSLLFLFIIRVHFYHYYFVLCPFLFVGLAALMLPWRRVLFGVILAQALVSVEFLHYIHDRGGAPQGDYGIPYSRQVAELPLPSSPRWSAL
jgi:hypothetical protein